MGRDTDFQARRRPSPFGAWRLLNNQSTVASIGYNRFLIRGPQLLGRGERHATVRTGCFCVVRSLQFRSTNLVSQDSGIPIQDQAKQSVSQDSAKAEDQGDRDHEWHLRLGAVSVEAAMAGSRLPSILTASIRFPLFYSSLFWDPYWGYFYPAGYFDHNDGKGEIHSPRRNRPMSIWTTHMPGKPKSSRASGWNLEHMTYLYPTATAHPTTNVFMC